VWATSVADAGRLGETSPGYGNLILVVPAGIARSARPDCTVPRGNKMLEAIKGTFTTRQSTRVVQLAIDDISIDDKSILVAISEDARTSTGLSLTRVHCR
jgi:hypothetical protein